MFSHNFAEDFWVIWDKVVRREPFALGRFGDGELSILQGIPVGNAEFLWEDDTEFQSELTKAFRFHADNYYIGICCPCCIPVNEVRWQRDMCGRDERYLTYNNIFVNANYTLFMRLYNEVLRNMKAVFICNALCNVENGWDTIRVSNNAWAYWEHYAELVCESAAENVGRVYLFSAGPLSEVLIHKAYLRNPANTYIDIGSTLDLAMMGKESRGYLSNNINIGKVCTWGK